MLSAAAIARFQACERALAAQPANVAAREAMLDELLASGDPSELPGSSLPRDPGRAPPRIAVITPYFRESLATLERCAASVRAQTVPAVHIFVADGLPRDELDTWPARHVRLPVNHADFGDTPRAIGGEVAIAEGCTAVAYLDADNVWRPRHLESLIACQEATGAAVCHAARTLHEIGGLLLPLLEAGDNVDHVDTSCVLVSQSAFELLDCWRRWPRPLCVIDDRLLWATARAQGFAMECTGALTVRYRADHAAYYRVLGRPIPADVRPDIDFSPVLAWYDALDATSRAELDRNLGFAVGPVLDARRPRIGGR